MNHAAAQLVAAIDWPRLGLEPMDRSDPATATAFVHRLRGRQTPSTGFTADYLLALRAAASPAQRDAARRRIEAALAEPLIGTAHANPVIRAGWETVILGMDTDCSLILAGNVLTARGQWATGPWGTTRGIVDLLRVLFPDPDVPDGALVPLLAWLTAQLPAEWNWARTWGETMLGNSGHNWFLHTYMGFWEAGLLFPEIKGMARFAELAPDYFEHEARLLMAPDGFTREASGYHWGTVDHFLQVLFLAEANRISFSPAFQRHLTAMAQTLWQARAPNGDVPRFGDAGARHAPDAALLPLRVMAALFQLPEAKYVAEALSPAWAPAHPGWLPAGGRNLLPDYRRLPSRRPPPDTALVDSGLYFMRSAWAPDADFAAIQAGPVGSIVSSHAHTDLLDLEVYSRGRPVLLDNCAGPYGDLPERRWRVGSSAHNVLTIDGQDQLPMLNEWRWERECTPFVNAWQTDERYAWFSAAHEAYRHLPARVASVRRKLFYLRGGYWILIDRTTPETDDPHTATLHFQVATPARLQPDGSLVTAAAAGNLLILPVAGARGEAAIEPCPYPLDGYDNPDHLTYTQTGAGGQLFVTLLIPFDSEPPAVRAALEPVHADDRALTPWEATGLRLDIDGRQDVYVDLHLQWNLPWSCGQHRGSSRWFHSRLAAGRQ